ncbi:MAG: TonB-dependent receptor, partial [Pseudomonadales bacterium]
MNTHLSKIKQTAIATSIAAVIAGAGSVHAQGTAVVLEEVIVTAERRSESVQDIGLSISAFSGDGLLDAGVYDVSRLAALVPGVNYSFAGNDAKFNVRGANSTNTFSDNGSIVGTYVDGVYKPRASQTTAAFYDIQRVEFLKGPQGTLYGRNTFAGAMNVWTNKPDLDGVSGGLEVGYSRFNTARMEAVINYPVSDNFGLRVAGYTESGDGYIENTAGPNLGVPDDKAIRISALWQAGDDVDVLLRYSSIKKDGASAGIFGYTNICANVTEQGITDHNGSEKRCDSSRLGSNGTPEFKDPWTISQDYAPDDEYGEDSFALTVTWDTGPVAITSITSYTDFVNNLQFDFDYSAANYSLGGFDEYSESYTQELQFTSNYDSALQWTGGLYLSKDETRFSFNIVNTRLDDDSGVEWVTGPDGNDYQLFYPGTPILNNIYNLDGAWADNQILETDTKGIYGQLEYSVTDSLRLVAGARYSDEEKELSAGGSL